ncbi:hypothetical protein E8E14_004612 [Neopestalotiopsis sp. 37M]|nr:hypothetical protein E8E14_004612 [Neopestalotiopsis sp. 37M]
MLSEKKWAAFLEKNLKDNWLRRESIGDVVKMGNLFWLGVRTGMFWLETGQRESDCFDDDWPPETEQEYWLCIRGESMIPLRRAQVHPTLLDWVPSETSSEDEWESSGSEYPPTFFAEREYKKAVRRFDYDSLHGEWSYMETSDIFTEPNETFRVSIEFNKIADRTERRKYVERMLEKYYGKPRRGRGEEQPDTVQDADSHDGSEQSDYRSDEVDEHGEDGEDDEDDSFGDPNVELSNDDGHHFSSPADERAKALGTIIDDYLDGWPDCGKVLTILTMHDPTCAYSMAFNRMGDAMKKKFLESLVTAYSVPESEMLHNTHDALKK